MPYAERILAMSGDAAVSKAIRWLNSYVDMPSRTDKSLRTVVTLFKPVVDVVPFIPAPGPFFWIAPQGTKLDHKRVAAFTSLGPNQWPDLAESIGMFDEHKTGEVKTANVYSVTNFYQLYNYVWVRQLVKAYPKLQVNHSFFWEKETVAWTTPRTNLRLVRTIQNPYL